MNDEDTLSSWLENHVGAWHTDPPRHCMSDFYHPTGLDETSYPEAPLFLQRDLRVHRDDNWPTKPAGLGTRPEDIKSFKERDEKRVDLALSLHERFASRLEGEDCREDHLYLLELREELRDRAGSLAARIDDEYCIGEQEGSGSTNVLEEAARFLIDLETAVQDFNSDEGTLKDVFQGRCETVEWGVSSRMRKWTSLIANSTDANDAIFQLAQPQMRSCLDLRDVGYRCGMDYLPANSSLKSIVTLFRSHFRELEDQVNRISNTQALLCYKLQVLQWVLREHAVYGTPDSLTRSMVERRTDSSLPNCLTGKGYSMDVERLLDAVHGYVTSDDADSAWSSFGRLDARDVFETLGEEELRKAGGESISENTLRRWLRKIPASYKEEWCRQSSFNREH